MASVTENIEEIVGTITILQKRLGKDVKEMCELVLCLREDFAVNLVSINNHSTFVVQGSIGA